MLFFKPINNITSGFLKSLINQGYTALVGYSVYLKWYKQQLQTGAVCCFCMMNYFTDIINHSWKNNIWQFSVSQQQKVAFKQTDSATYLALELLQRIDSRVMARHELMTASRNTAPQLHALLPIPGVNRSQATQRLGIIKQGENRLKCVAPACLRLLQVRAKDTFLSEIPPSCESSSCGCLKCSTLCVIGWKIICVTRSVY